MKYQTFRGICIYETIAADKSWSFGFLIQSLRPSYFLQNSIFLNEGEQTQARCFQ